MAKKDKQPGADVAVPSAGTVQGPEPSRRRR
jgi:hypothetical protein